MWDKLGILATMYVYSCCECGIFFYFLYLKPSFFQFSHAQAQYPYRLPTLVKGLECPSFWIMWVALALKVEFGTVQIMALVFTTAAMLLMPASDAKVRIK